MKDLVAILVPLGCGMVLPLGIVWMIVKRKMAEDMSRKEIFEVEDATYVPQVMALMHAFLVYLMPFRFDSCKIFIFRRMEFVFFKSISYLCRTFFLLIRV